MEYTFNDHELSQFLLQILSNNEEFIEYYNEEILSVGGELSDDTSSHFSINTSRKHRNITSAKGACKIHFNRKGYKNSGILSCEHCVLEKSPCLFPGCPCENTASIYATLLDDTFFHVLEGDDRYTVIRSSHMKSTLKRVKERMDKLNEVEKPIKRRRTSKSKGKFNQNLLISNKQLI